MSCLKNYLKLLGEKLKCVWGKRVTGTRGDRYLRRLLENKNYRRPTVNSDKQVFLKPKILLGDICLIERIRYQRLGAEASAGAIADML